MAETTRTLISDDDVVVATTAATDASGQGPWAHEVRDALEAVAPRLRGRWVAEALDRMAADLQAEAPHQRSTTWDSLRHAADMVQRGADEYRAGTR